MLDRPLADQYSVVTRSHGRPPSWRWESNGDQGSLGSASRFISNDDGWVHATTSYLVTRAVEHRAGWG